MSTPLKVTYDITSDLKISIICGLLQSFLVSRYFILLFCIHLLLKLHKKIASCNKSEEST